MEQDISYVRNLLKRFGTLIYTGNQLEDATLMELELQDLYEWKMIDEEEFMKSKMIIRKYMKK